VVDNLLLAADKYGHGKVIDAETFEAGYVASLAEMTNEKKQHEDLFLGERMFFLVS
jgi:hypothetical protein